MTVQVFVDTILLSWHNPDEMAASFPAVMWFWLPFGLLQVTAGYVSTFVAQYTGAKRPQRVGPAVWQGIYFALAAGLAFLVVVPAAPYLIELGGHTERMQELETIYLQCLCFAALPMLVMAAVNGFFSGRGQTWTVLGIEAVGTTVNVFLALFLIFGRAGLPHLDLPGWEWFASGHRHLAERFGIPELGIAGAGWATVAGSVASAMFALGLLFRSKYRSEFNTLGGWRFERELFGRLMKYGGPAGMQVFLDVLVFLLFVLFVGRLGEAELGATTLTVRLNMVAFLPMMGLGQAICILVGQRLGGDRPDLAERSAYTGLAWSFGYMCLVAGVYLLLPETLVSIFESRAEDAAKFEAIAAIVPTLLIFVAVYSVMDSVNLSFAFALRGAGDTRFVTAVTFVLAWPVMVIPTYLVWKFGGSVYWAWGFATAHIFGMGVCFWLRFRTGKWKAMRVIEPDVSGEPADDPEAVKQPAA
jgi:MATE family multidrug resistance protein